MQELSKTEMLNINGGSSFMITPYYGFIKAMRWITKFVSSKF